MSRARGRNRIGGQRPRCLRRSLGTFLLACLLADPLQAHPHAWIGLELEAIGERPAQLDGFAITWRFDPIYTLLLTEDIPASASESDRQEALDRLGGRILESIANFDYLLFIDRPATGIDGGSGRLRQVSINGRGELVLQFERQFDTALDLSREPLQYRIYDPAFYIQMEHDSRAAIQLGPALAHCSVHLAAARPDPAAIALAARLDIGGDPAGDIGRAFAETVTIDCP